MLVLVFPFACEEPEFHSVVTTNINKNHLGCEIITSVEYKKGFHFELNVKSL